MSSKITEQEVVSQLASALDAYLQQAGAGFQRASVETSLDAGRPDLVIWTDYPAKKAFAFWEFKRPNRSEDLHRLPDKAKSLGVQYVVVWNFQYGELYEVSSEGLLPLQAYPAPLLVNLEEWADQRKRLAVVEQAKKILDDLARLAKGEALLPYHPDKFYFIGVLHKAIQSLLPCLREYLLQRQKEVAVRRSIHRWAVQQGYPTGLPDLEAILGGHWAYSLAVRILFYFTVRRYYPGLPDLQLPPEGVRLAHLLYEAFAKAQQVDWQAVFELSPLDQLGLPPKADPILRELLEDFHRYDFGLLKEDVIGQIMEGLVPEQERHALGQYFTREDLVDFILGFVANKEQGFYLDPTCGSGTFLNRLYSRLRYLSGYQASHAQLLERLWGVDIAHFPAELATINLFRQNVRDVSNFPRILVQDFFKVHLGQTVHFPPLKALPELLHQRIEVSIPPFYGIVGNFPYIRQELIERQIPGYKRQIVQTIAQDWFWLDPDLFTADHLRKNQINTIRNEGHEKNHHWLQTEVQEGRIDLRLSGQADIYAYLFYHAGAFLEEGGRLGIVTSNAWMDVAYGLELKRFFLRHFKIIAIVASWIEPWFQDAAINTAFIILQRCENAQERAKNIVRFVKVKKPLTELLPKDLLLREPDRWRHVDALVRQIEAADLQVAFQAQTAHQQQPLQGVHTLETPDFRIRLVPQAELDAELQSKGETAKWGLYIRAPQVYFDILKQAGDRLVPLGQLAEVRRGYTTGINDFFYLEPLRPGKTPGTLRVQNARGWIGEIEEACLRPVIKSPKEAKGLVVDPAALKYRLFLPPIQTEEHEKELYSRFPLAARYVEWGAQQRTSQNRPWPQVPSVRGRKSWWLLPAEVLSNFLWVKSYDDTFRVLIADELIFPDQRIYAITPIEKAHQWLLAALLNGFWTFLETEMKGRVNLGDGVLDTAVYEVQKIFVPHPNIIPDHIAKKILKAFHRLRKRPVKPIFEEVKQKDRRALDEAVLEALGLDPKRYLPPIYQGLVEMVQERLSLPEKRKLQLKEEKRVALQQIKDKVRQELFPAGLKRIAAFLPGQPKMLQVPLTGRPVGWKPFLTKFLLVDQEGREVGLVEGVEAQARYAVYAARIGEYMVEIPARGLLAGKIVQQYELYLRQTGQELYSRLFEAIRDHKQVSQAARDILESLGLPPIGIEKAMGE